MISKSKKVVNYLKKKNTFRERINRKGRREEGLMIFREKDRNYSDSTRFKELTVIPRS